MIFRFPGMIFRCGHSGTVFSGVIFPVWAQSDWVEVEFHSPPQAGEIWFWITFFNYKLLKGRLRNQISRLRRAIFILAFYLWSSSVFSENRHGRWRVDIAVWESKLCNFAKNILYLQRVEVKIIYSWAAELKTVTETAIMMTYASYGRFSRDFRGKCHVFFFRCNFPVWAERNLFFPV